MNTENKETKTTNQKEAVFAAVTAALKDANVTVDKPIALLMTPALRKEIRAKIVAGIVGNTISYKSMNRDEKKIKEYAAILLGNWLNRDPRYSK